MKTLDIVTIALGGSLYAIVGIMTHLGFFTPVIGVVRFWPAVVVPAVFSILFGPIVGGLGAAIGIFMSDMVVHGNPLLSLTVGVPSNFVGFYLIGFIGRRRISDYYVFLGSLIGGTLAITSLLLNISGHLDTLTSILFFGICISSSALTLIISWYWPRWRTYGIASIIGLGVGSGIIGLGVWAFSQYFLLPSGEIGLPLYASILWFLWTFATEIPFLIVFVPPILKACFAVFPALRTQM